LFSQNLIWYLFAFSQKIEMIFLLVVISQSIMSGHTGFKQPLSKFSDVIQFPDTIDLHAWHEVDDSGKISDYDEDSDMFDEIKFINKLSGNMVRVRMPHEEEQKAFRFIYKIIKKKIKGLIPEDQEMTKRAISYWFCEPGNCFTRAFIVSKMLGSRKFPPTERITFEKIYKNPAILLDNKIPVIGMRFGSAGWKCKSNDKIWYEYG